MYSQSVVLLLLLSILGSIGCKNATLDAGSGSGSDKPKRPSGSAVSDRSYLSQPLHRAHPEHGKSLFESIPAATCGIDFLPKWQPRDDYEALMLKTGFTGGGACLGDFDGDRLADLFLTRSHGGGRLYRNLGGFRFEDVTQSSGVYCPDDWHTGATFCDINNDGRLDLVVACLGSPSRMFLNQDDGKFVDVARESGFDFSGAAVKWIFADYDKDGDLDAYLITNRLEPKSPTEIRYVGEKGTYAVASEHQELAMVINLPSGEQKFAKAGQFDRLFRNDLDEKGQLRFSDVTRQAGLSGNYHGLDGCWWDADGDGDADLYITNDFTDPDQFYLNQGDGTFVDVTKESLPSTPWFAMGCDVGDLNNDGRLDLLAADMAGTSHYRQKMSMGSMDAVSWFLDFAEPRQAMRNALYINTGTPRFVETAQLAGLANSDWTWSVKIADFDNDGREDVFFTNGFTRDYLNSDFNDKLKAAGEEGKQKSLAWYDAPRLDEQNLAFRNEGNLHFRDVSTEWGVDQRGISFGAAVGDLDNDGDLDLIVNNFEAAPSIYRNTTVSDDVKAHALLVDLVSSDGKSPAIGASVEVCTVARADGDNAQHKQTRYHNPSGGFLSSDDATLHFGLGNATSIDRLTVRWPNGQEQTLRDVVADQRIRITQPASTGKLAQQSSANSVKLFIETHLLDHVVHRERPFDDFGIQPLLPNKLSQLGPGMAAGDVNGDGRIDLFIGGASGQVGQLLLQQNDQSFKTWSLSCLEQHRFCEDMGCLLFDVDGDLDLDLFVVSGGVEQRPGAPTYRDRLYRNVSSNAQAEADLRFEYVENALPDVRDSGGTVAAADFDEDGDLDLFVGGRVTPGEYPISPKSRLLRNKNGKFEEVSTTSLDDIGMVTSALWSDFDNDGRVDLLLAHDYGPIRVLRNQPNGFVDVSTQLQTNELLGWWNSLTGCDLDCDGDTDYVVGNLGLNTKYHPSQKKPQHLFYGNFQGGERNHIVEAKSNLEASGDVSLLPVRGRSCSSSAMPFIKTKFGNYHDFASATLGEIYTQASLSAAKRVTATVAESGILINRLLPDGRRVFEFTPLPLEAQLAPVFGIETIHVNDDAYPDLFLAQNFYTPQRETGRMNGGVGCVLLGQGNGLFTPISPAQSGIVIPQDAKSSIATDLDADHKVDLVVAINDGAIRTFELASAPKDDSQNPALESKVERYLGSGYLSSKAVQ